MCNCIEQVRESIIEEHNANYVQIDCSTITAFKPKEVSQYKTGQRFTVNYNHVKRNGETVAKNINSFVTHVYCPFCGTKY
jgi:hypothetical protein